MAAQPQPFPIVPAGRQLPDYLPARMVNEFVYCPRLFFCEWVDGLFRDSSDTVEGRAQHARVDDKTTALPEAVDLKDEEKLHARSVTLTSERLRVIAKLDLVEAVGGVATPVDYKHGRPADGDDGGVAAWPADRVQLALQGAVLRENGYQSDEGVGYYRRTKQRVRIRFDEATMREAEAAVADAWRLARYGEIPPPLVDSPKCPGCSMAGICLPDETALLRLGWDEEDSGQMELFDQDVAGRKPPAREVRRLVTPRVEKRPLYLNTPGLRVGKSGEVLQVKDKEKLVQEVRIHEISQVNLMGNIQLTTQAIQTLLELEIPVCFFSMGGWFHGIATGMNTKNVFLRQRQFRLADSEWFGLALARQLVAGKIRNQRVMLQRNHEEPKGAVLLEMKQWAERAERAGSLEGLLGIEGNAARIYFGQFAGMIRTAEDEGRGAGRAEFDFDFEGRNRRPPKDPVNALLSLAYSVLARDLTVACYSVGFDPLMGFYHQPRFGRPALALDLMEPFRPLIADSAVLTAINTGMVRAADFVKAGPAVALTAGGRKAFFRAYELRMDTLVTHPLFGYRVSYRRLLEIQARLLARVMEGEIAEYPVFVTR
jgi:CRISPR-associated protein Cas1